LTPVKVLGGRSGEDCSQVITEQHMSMKVVRLELARDASHPQGDAGHGYEFRAPLTAEGHIDHQAWLAERGLCKVRRFGHNMPDEHGLLLRTGRGQWVFSYEPGDDDDERIFRFGAHRFSPGEYMSLTEHDGVQRTFKVTAVNDWHPAGGGASTKATPS